MLHVMRAVSGAEVRITFGHAGKYVTQGSMTRRAPRQQVEAAGGDGGEERHHVRYADLEAERICSGSRVAESSPSPIRYALKMTLDRPAAMGEQLAVGIVDRYRQAHAHDPFRRVAGAEVRWMPT